MGNIRRFSDIFGQIHTSFVCILKGVRFGLQTLSFQALFMTFPQVKKTKKPLYCLELARFFLFLSRLVCIGAFFIIYLAGRGAIRINNYELKLET